MQILVCGVCGSGKSTLAAALCAELADARLVEADDFHSPANRAKMAAGHPLTDEDRWPWLEAVRAAATMEAPGSVVVVACSALKRAYRRILAPIEVLVVLEGDTALLEERLGKRRGHFLDGAQLLRSQYAAWEPIDEEEAADFWIDVDDDEWI